MAFDPDKYLVEKTTGASGFDPDKYLQEKSGVAPSDQPLLDSQGRSFLGNIAQGASAGLALPGASAVQTLSDVLHGRVGLGDVGEDYRGIRDDLKSRFGADNAANPKTAIAGQLLGGVIPAALTGGTSAEAEGLSAADKALNATKISAGYGAVSGAANSDADLTKGQVGQTLDDAIKGALVGGATGAALHGVVEDTADRSNLLGKLGGAIKDSKIGKSFAKGVQGVNLSDLETHANNLGDVTQKLAKGTEDVRNAVSKEYTQVYDMLDNSGVSTDLKPTFEKYLAKAQQMQENSFPGEAAYDDGETLKQMILNRLQGPEVTKDITASKFSPEQTEDVPATPSARDLLRAKLDKYNALTRAQGGDVTPDAGAVGNPDASLVDVPGEGDNNYVGIQDKNRGITDIRPDTPGSPASTQVTPAVKGPEYKTGSYTTREGADTNYSPSDLNALKKTVSGMTSFNKSQFESQEGENLAKQFAGEIGDQQPDALNNVDDKYAAIKNAQDLLGIKPDDITTDPMTGEEKIAPSAFNRISNEIRRLQTDESTASLGANNRFSQVISQLKKVAPDFAASIEPAINEASENVNLSRQTNNASLLHGSPWKTVRGNSMGIANKFGQGVSMIRSMGEWTGDQFKAFANAVSKDGDAGERLSNILSEAADRDSVGKNALLFTILQNPAYRELVNKHLGE